MLIILFKVLLKTVEVEPGLPQKILDSTRTEICSNDLIKSVVKDTHMFDATQTKLQKSWNVPYVGWHPVEDRMFRPMPYDVTAMSWGRKVRREYGIPLARKK